MSNVSHKIKNKINSWKMCH